MGDHGFTENVTLLLANDALEANGRNITNAVCHLLDAAGSLIVHAHKHNGADGKGALAESVVYLIDQVEPHLGVRS